MYVCRHVCLKTVLNVALSFLRIVTVGDKLLKMFMPACYVLFLKTRQVGRDGIVYTY
jgi:hypothetical protein